jgi:hypothetical protein
MERVQLWGTPLLRPGGWFLIAFGSPLIFRAARLESARKTTSSHQLRCGINARVRSSCATLHGCLLDGHLDLPRTCVLLSDLSHFEFKRQQSTTYSVCAKVSMLLCSKLPLIISRLDIANLPLKIISDRMLRAYTFWTLKMFSCNINVPLWGYELAFLDPATMATQNRWWLAAHSPWLRLGPTQLMLV